MTTLKVQTTWNIENSQSEGEEGEEPKSSTTENGGESSDMDNLSEPDIDTAADLPVETINSKSLADSPKVSKVHIISHNSSTTSLNEKEVINQGQNKTQNNSQVQKSTVDKTNSNSTTKSAVSATHSMTTQNTTSTSKTPGRSRRRNNPERVSMIAIRDVLGGVGLNPRLREQRASERSKHVVDSKSAPSKGKKPLVESRKVGSGNSSNWKRLSSEILPKENLEDDKSGVFDRDIGDIGGVVFS